jgi:hypothetical protein
MRSVVTATPDIDLRCCSNSSIRSDAEKCPNAGAIHLPLAHFHTILSNFISRS